MKTYAELQQEVISEDKLTLDVNPMKERNLHFLYILLGIGIVILIAGVALLLVH